MPPDKERLRSKETTPGSVQKDLRICITYDTYRIEARRVKAATPRRILQYLAKNGFCPFEEWFVNLKDLMGKAVVAARIEKIRQGLETNLKAVGDGVLESKIDHGPGYRIYLGKDGNEIVVLLIGGTKRRQDRDIAEAKEFWKDYLRSRNAKEM